MWFLLLGPFPFHFWCQQICTCVTWKFALWLSRPPQRAATSSPGRWVPSPDWLVPTCLLRVGCQGCCGPAASCSAPRFCSLVSSPWTSGAWGPVLTPSHASACGCPCWMPQRPEPVSSLSLQSQSTSAGQSWLLPSLTPPGPGSGKVLWHRVTQCRCQSSWHPW